MFGAKVFDALGRRAFECLWIFSQISCSHLLDSLPEPLRDRALPAVIPHGSSNVIHVHFLICWRSLQTLSQFCTPSWYLVIVHGFTHLDLCTCATQRGMH